MHDLDESLLFFATDGINTEFHVTEQDPLSHRVLTAEKHELEEQCKKLVNLNEEIAGELAAAVSARERRTEVRHEQEGRERDILIVARIFILRATCVLPGCWKPKHLAKAPRWAK